MDSLKVEYIQTADLVPYAGNAKIHTPEQIEQIKRSIQEFGFNDPIAVWHGNEIIEGHGRLIAAKELGIKSVPIIRLDDLTDEQRRAYTLVHNKLTMNTDFDFTALEAELESLSIDMEEFGFSAPEAEEVDNEVIEDDYEEPEQIEPKTNVGDIFRLGDHYLMCGDSTDPEHVSRLVGGGVDRFMRDRSSVQCGDRERSAQKERRTDDNERRLGEQPCVYRLFKIRVRKHDERAETGRRFLYLVRKQL